MPPKVTRKGWLKRPLPCCLASHNNSMIWIVFHEEYSLFLNFSDSASFKYNQWISLHFLCNFTRIYRFRETKKTHVNKVLNNFNLQQKLKIQKDTLKNCSAFLSRDCDARLLWPGLQKSNLPLEIWPIAYILPLTTALDRTSLSSVLCFVSPCNFYFTVTVVDYACYTSVFLCMLNTAKSYRIIA